MLNVVVIDCCLTLLYCAFQPVVALINHLLTYLLTRELCMDAVAVVDEVAVYRHGSRV